jgi:hypothetical protein
MNEDLVRTLQTQVKQLQQELAMLRVQLDNSAERPAVFGRNRHSLWGVLVDELPAGGAADVELKRRDAVGQWETLWTMEDVLAPPIMPAGTCLPVGTWVRVTWFPADQECFVTGAETCPRDCSDSSSSGA